MILWAVLGTGESMNRETADMAREHCNVVAVSDAYRLAPWADVLVSNDSAWWRTHPEAMNFAGIKYSGAKVDGTLRIPAEGGFETSCNSGLLGMRVAERLGATKILLLGFDLRGTHFFGAHPAPLQNTSPKRFQQMIGQFKKWRGCEVVNCTPNSALKLFPYVPLKEALGN